ncbi:MAG: response regulator [Clostridiales bacterium]|nr:response regulator [Clostridiales bacterium]
MKLLIVDDEKLTREGLSGSINWKSLGIDHVYEADDGINGLNLVKKYKPDIILTDIRMPRMNGIELAQKAHEILPNSSLIFMSGYSDKEYLKAAIKLNAINYIEKPINPSEVRDTIKRAANTISQRQLLRQSEDLRRKEALTKIVLELNYLNTESRIQKLLDDLKELGYSINPSSFFNTFIIRMIEADELLNSLNLISIETYIDAYLKNRFANNIRHIIGIKQGEFIIVHLFYDLRTSSSFITKVLEDLSRDLTSIGNFFICLGKRVTGISNLYKSYNTAVITLQNAFFHDINSLIVYKENDNKNNISVLPDALIEQFEFHLKNKDENGTFALLDELYYNLRGNLNFISYTAKDFYYRMFLKLEEIEKLFHIRTSQVVGDKHPVLDTVMTCQTLTKLHSLLEDSVRDLINKSKEVAQDSIQVTYIKEYINQNYMNNNLSIKSISDFIKLSPSYICTIFKNETNQTLNQYITMFRIDKAKQLLVDPRNKISDISEQVGYTDSNYFSKSFKKIVGLSPTEFREQNMT